MKTPTEIIEYYFSDLLPTVQEVEGQREKARKRALVIWGIVFAITAPFALAYGWAQPDISILLFLLYIAFLIVVYSLISVVTSTEYEEAFIRKIVGSIVKHIAPGLSYSARDHVPSSIFRKSQLLHNGGIDRYNGRDRIAGKVHGVKIELSAVHIEKEHEYEERVSESETKTRTEYETIFKGIFLHAAFPKTFNGHTIVLTESIEGIFDSLFGGTLSHNSLKLERIKLDHPEFEEHFFTYGTDQIEARYILSHSMMERILRFRKRVGHKISLSFAEGDIFIAVHDIGLSLEPPFYSSLLERKVAEDYIETIFFLTGIVAIGAVEELKLDQKLWRQARKTPQHHLQ